MITYLQMMFESKVWCRLASSRQFDPGHLTAAFIPSSENQRKQRSTHPLSWLHKTRDNFPWFIYRKPTRSSSRFKASSFSLSIFFDFDALDWIDMWLQIGSRIYGNSSSTILCHHKGSNGLYGPCLVSLNDIITRASPCTLSNRLQNRSFSVSITCIGIAESFTQVVIVSVLWMNKTLICINNIIRADLAASFTPSMRLVGVPPSKGRGRHQGLSQSWSQPLPSPSSSCSIEHLGSPK